LRQIGSGREPTINRLSSHSGAFLVPPSQAPSPRSIVGHRDPTEQFYEATSITADDVARIIAFAVGQPRSVSLNEILVRPTAQA